MPEEAIVRSPASPSAAKTRSNGSDFKPYEVNPDLASAKLAEIMIERAPDPGIVSKEFVIWLGIFRGLNHSQENKTYYDSSLLVSIFEGVSHNSVNINGALFEKSWQYLMKPKMIVQGLPGQMSFQEEEDKRESLLSRMMGWFRGGDKNANKSD